MKKRLLWQIYPALLAIMLIALLAISWNVSILLKRFYTHEKTAQLERLAGVAAPLFEGIVVAEDDDRIQAACMQLREATQMRFTVIDLDGRVLADSDDDPRQMENHLMRPEVQAVLDGRTGSDIRTSRTIQEELLYVGLPLMQNGQTAAVLRIAVPLERLQQTMRSVQVQMFRYGLMIALLLALLSLALSWKISRPLETLRLGAERFAQGDLNHRLPTASSREIAVLAESMNQMAAQLDQRIRTIMNQRNEQQAVLSSMVEGVLAVDGDGRMMSVNNAAAEMLQTAPEDCIGRTIEEVMRNTALQHFVRSAMAADASIEDHIILHEGALPECHLQAHGTPLLGDAGDAIGVLVVLNDITRIHRLEQVRRDFVANVSHELKTPVTSIKGFIETLLDGAADSPDDRRRFLEIIARQAHRLDSIIDDLLTLSRVEQQGEKEQLDIAPSRIKLILTAAAGLCQLRADEKNIHIEIDCDDTLEACVNASLIEQAIVNLIDNAVKYSPTEGRVLIQAAADASELRISVSDRGCGIAPEHLSRLFERFYRVDKARSRKLGGTGLGLSIVKHIAQSHKGHVTVESRLNEGSTFVLHLPHC